MSYYVPVVSLWYFPVQVQSFPCVIQGRPRVLSDIKQNPPRTPPIFPTSPKGSPRLKERHTLLVNDYGSVKPSTPTRPTRFPGSYSFQIFFYLTRSKDLNVRSTVQTSYILSLCLIRPRSLLYETREWSVELELRTSLLYGSVWKFLLSLFYHGSGHPFVRERSGPKDPSLRSR